MPAPTVTEFFKNAALATASYVRMGSQPLSLRTNGALFAAQAASVQQSGGRLPASLGTALFNPADPNAPRWNILDYYGGDALEFAEDKSGFAATLFQQGNEKVLAIRGTEPSEDLILPIPGIGGVDLLSADLGQLGTFGLAVTQTVSMVNYISRLTTRQDHFASQIRVVLSPVQPESGRYVDVQGRLGSTLYLLFTSAEPVPGLEKIQAGEVVKLTGHSLGGHLAAIAARLFPDIFDPNVVVFNSAGYDPTTENFLELLKNLSPVPGVSPAVIAEPLKAAIALELGPGALLLETHANQRSAQVVDKINETLGRISIKQGTPTVISLRSEDLAPADDWDVVASALTGADRYGPPIEVSTEANSHVIEPFLDALSLHALLASMNSALTLSDTNKVLEAISVRARDSDESLLGAFYKALKGPSINLPLSDATTGFSGLIRIGKGDINARDAYYARLLELQESIRTKPALKLLSLAEMSADSLRNLAIYGDLDALAYRYALKELNPFAVVGDLSLYGAHNAKGELKLFASPSETPAGMTEQYLADRAQMLAFLASANAGDTATMPSAEVSGQVLYQDLVMRQVIEGTDAKPVELLVFAPNLIPNSRGPNTSVVGFGSDSSDALQGRDNTDRLYGGTGADLLTGGKGNDYLEGGAGMDVYAYSAETSILSPNTNDGDDELRDTDGRGALRYTFTGSGNSGTTSRVIGGAALKITPTQWRSPDEKFVYGRQGSDLLVTITGDAGGSIMIRGFDFAAAETGGYLGIHFADQLSAPDSLARTFHGDKQDWDSDPAQEGVQIQIDAFGNAVRADGQEGRPDLAQADRADTFYGSSGEEAERFTTAGGDDVVYGDGPSSFTSSQGGRDLIEAGAGRDVVTAGAGNDWLEGGSGGDVLGGNLGDDTLFGDSSAGQVWTLAQAIAFGESGVPAAGPGDLLTGDAGNDVVVGAATADLVYGGEGADVIVGGAGADNIYGDGTVTAATLDWQATRGIAGSGELRIYQLSTSGLVASIALDVGSGDTIYGGAGADWIFAGAGDDYVEGGNSEGDANVDDDVIFGEAGSDILIGGSGKDSLHGDSASVDTQNLSGDDYLDGGAGDDELIGYKGDDVLIGGEGRDTLVGGEGDDIIWGGPGNDIVLRGPGKDSFVYHRGDGRDVVRSPVVAGGGDFLDSLVLGPGIVRSDVKFLLGSLIVDLGAGDAIHLEGFNPDNPSSTPVLGSIQFADGEVMTYEDILALGITIDGTEGDDSEASLIEGTQVRDLIDAKAGNDVVLAKGGNDEVLGGAGDDELDAGEGDDLVDGGAGADSIEGRGGNDVLTGGEGDDFISADEGDDQVDGGAGADTLLGGAGADTLAGGSGDDMLDGGGGNDALAGGEGIDSYVLQGRSGVDLVTDGEGGETNVVRLGAGLTLDNIAATRDGDALRIGLRGLSDALAIQDYYTRAQSWVVRDEAGTDTALEDVIDRPDPHAGDFVARLWADTKLGHVADAVGLMVNEIGWKPLGGLAFQSIAESAWLHSTSQTTTETFTRVDPPHEVLASNVTFTSEHELDGFGVGGPLFRWSQAVFEIGRQESDAAAIFGVPIEMPQEQYPGQQALVTLKLDPRLFNVQHTQSSESGGVVSYDTGTETLLATVTYEYDIRHYNRSGQVVEVDADPGPWGPPLNTVAGNRVLVNMTQVVDRYRLVDEIVGGDSSNLIFTGHAGNLVFTKKTLVDAGGGDDQVFGSGLLYGSSGADRIEGSGSVLIGGDGDDVLIGRDGSRFVYLATEAGIDRVSEPTEYQQAYLAWFYGNLGIADWEYRAEHGGEYAVAVGEGGLDHFDTYEEAFAAHPQSEITFVEPLPAVPAVRREDTAALDLLIEAGIMPRDTVQFGPGLELADLELAVTVPGFVADEHPEQPWHGGGTLSARWGSAGFDLELPAASAYRVGEGIESFEFAGGGRYSLDTILQAASVTRRYHHDFRRGSGEQIIDPRSPEVVFQPGIAVADVAITRDGVDLVLRLNDFSASGRVEGWFADPANMPGIGLRFADGTSIGAQELTSIALTQQGSPFDDVLESIDGFANRLHGMGGNDVLHGANADDVLEGGEGDDQLDGGAGKDTYVFNRGDGVDTISDASSGEDASVIVFGPDIFSWQIQLGLGSLVLNYGGEAIHFSAFDSGDPYAAPVFDRLEFDDGASMSYREVLELGFQLIGTEGDDVMTGTGVRDFMSGGEGSDTYIYAPGGGYDQIADWDEALDDVDTLQLTGGILPAEVRVTRDDWSYYLVFGAADRIVLDSMAREPRAEIERIELDDGTLWTPADLAARVELLPGTERDDVLWGTAGADTLEGLGGDDSLFGNAGNDFLAGGEGADFYYFAAGDGADVVDNYDTDGSSDSIFFAEASSTDAALARRGDDLVIRIGGGSDRVTLAGWYSDQGRKIDDVSFAGDGVFWDAATLEALAPLEGGNSPPEAANPIADQQATEDAAYTFQFASEAFSDPGDTLAYSAGGLPAWLSFDADTRTFSGTPGLADGGEYRIEVTATDTAGAAAAASFGLTVSDSLARGNRLIGTQRDDVLNGTDAAEFLDGRGGSDRLLAGGGDDFLQWFADGRARGRSRSLDFFDGGAGFDTLLGSDGHDALRLDNGRGAPRLASIERIAMGKGDDRVNLRSTRFAYGDVILDGGDGHDVLRASSGDDVLVGGRGDDLLSGGAGRDVYIHELRGGHDTIDEAGAEGELDALRFGEGITRDMVRARRHRDDLVLDLSGPHGSVTVKDWFGPSAQRVESIEFADGAAWDEKAIRKAVRHWHDDDCHEPARHDDHRQERRGRSADERGSPRDDRPAHDGTAAISERLSQSLSFDFEALARELDRKDERPLTPQQIQRRWAAVQHYVSALALENEEDDAGAGGWRDFSAANLLGAGGFGFEASIGAARGPETLKSLEGLSEGFRRL